MPEDYQHLLQLKVSPSWPKTRKRTSGRTLTLCNSNQLEHRKVGTSSFTLGVTLSAFQELASPHPPHLRPIKRFVRTKSCRRRSRPAWMITGRVVEGYFFGSSSSKTLWLVPHLHWHQSSMSWPRILARLPFQTPLLPSFSVCLISSHRTSSIICRPADSDKRGLLPLSKPPTSRLHRCAEAVRMPVQHVSDLVAHSHRHASLKLDLNFHVLTAPIPVWHHCRHSAICLPPTKKVTNLKKRRETSLIDVNVVVAPSCLVPVELS